tara:strand:- start:107 stop:586 length:480 start_codon:yes stop_codon:yes gene_type:complete
MNDKNQLFKYAIDYLSKYNSSKDNLKRILNKKVSRMKIEKKYKFELYNSIPNILIKLEKNKFIDDLNYSLSKIRFFISIGKSRIYIKNYLFQKGISTNIIANSLEENDKENPDWEINSARIFIKKKNFTNSIKEKEKNLSKMARAGFSYYISKKILEEI